jgi:peptidase M28-like protein/PA domain-containing protein
VWRWLLGGLAVVVVVLAVVLAAGGSSGGGAGSSADPVSADLATLQRVADDNGGTRAAGTPGDRATGEYLARRLKDDGYRVTTQSFTVQLYREKSPPLVRIDGQPLRDIRTLQFSPSGRATGRVRATGLGCSRGDFDALRPGEVALIRRGRCFFFQKAALARRAGAAAALVVNTGPKPPPGSLFRFGPGIPVVGVGRAAGAGLDGTSAFVAVDAVSEPRATTNVIGEIGPRGAPHVIMAGAHRDSVPAGPGLNDDGSGVAALLAMADRFPANRLPPRAALRIAFWGGEELGLLGSRHYVDRLSAAGRQRIAAYLNLDMVASPRARVRVYDSDNRIEATYRRHLPPHAPQVRLIGDSDHASFEAGNIPAGGIFTGLDACYHQACDTIHNVDRKVLATSIRATEGALEDLLAR